GFEPVSVAPAFLSCLVGVGGAVVGDGWGVEHGGLEHGGGGRVALAAAEHGALTGAGRVAGLGPFLEAASRRDEFGADGADGELEVDEETSEGRVVHAAGLPSVSVEKRSGATGRLTQSVSVRAADSALRAARTRTVR